jgi:hypothetical protein
MPLTDRHATPTAFLQQHNLILSNVMLDQYFPTFYG